MSDERFEVGQTVWLGSLNKVRSGTIVKAQHDPRPIYVDAQNFEWAGATIDTDQLPGGPYLVLYIPPPLPPHLGDWLDRDQVAALPLRATVVSGLGYAYQLDSVVNGRWWVGARDLGNEETMWRDAEGKLMLVWLPSVDVSPPCDCQ